jgi:hypothetical protein
MTMKTKAELFEYLKTFEVGTTPLVKNEAMEAIFGVCLSRSTVEAWLSEIGLSSFEVKNAGCGQTAAWIFEHRS